MIAAGAVLIIAALRMGLGIRRMLLVASALAIRVPWLRDADDAFITRLAVAPRCRVARAIVVAVGTRDITALAAGLRLLTSVAIALPVAILALLLAGPLATAPLFVSAALLGARLPDVALAAAAGTSTRRARHGTAAAVDMLAATAATGLTLPEAMVLTAAHAPPPVAAALRAAAVRRAMGEEPRAALHTESSRFGVPALAAVAGAVDRQRRLGVPLAPELAAIASRLRHDQRAAALERAARRAPLGTLIVALAITPACLTAVIACLLGGLLQGGSLPLR